VQHGTRRPGEVVPWHGGQHLKRRRVAGPFLWVKRGVNRSLRKRHPAFMRAAGHSSIRTAAPV
jgi:hypothetical protein